MASDGEDEAMQAAPESGQIRFGEVTAATAETKARGVARGNIEIQDADADTLQLPEAYSRFCRCCRIWLLTNAWPRC